MSDQYLCARTALVTKRFVVTRERTLGAIRHSRGRSAIGIENGIVINAQFGIPQSPVLAVQPLSIILFSTTTRFCVSSRFRVGIDDFAMFRMSFDVCL